VSARSEALPSTLAVEISSEIQAFAIGHRKRTAHSIGEQSHADVHEPRSVHSKSVWVAVRRLWALDVPPAIAEAHTLDLCMRRLPTKY
jgi:hypothetical protein